MSFGMDRATELYNRGNEKYGEGQFREALDLYSQVDRTNADLFFNMGNTHLKLGQLGHAIIYYLRAERLRPRDPEIVANLEFARLLKADKEVRHEVSALNQILDFSFRFFSLRELFQIGIILYLLVFACAFGYLLSTTPQRKSAAALLGAFLLFLFVCHATVTGFKMHYELFTHRAVVTAGEVSARAAPDSSAEVLFSFHEGTEVVVTRSEKNWSLVKLATGWTGWVPTDSFESV
jgi:tetratricopeptide (TPR) repeat protein